MDVCFCGVPLSVSQRERCPQPGCPCYGMRAGSPEMERAARAALARPYSRRGNVTGAEARAVLDEQFADPVEARAHAYVKARSASTLNPNIGWREAMAQLGISAVGHEPGRPG
jgi:hypothetical protein